MGIFSVKATGPEIVRRHLNFHKVDEKPGWVGAGGNLLYIPRDKKLFTPDDSEADIVSRWAFSAERAIKDPESPRRFSDSSLGQAAILRHGGDGVALAIVVPIKEVVLAPAVDQMVTAPFGEEAPEELLQSMIVDAILKSLVQKTR